MLTWESRKIIPKVTHPNKIATPFVIFVAVESFSEGKNGRMKSSRMMRATEFKPLDKEL